MTNTTAGTALVCMLAFSGVAFAEDQPAQPAAQPAAAPAPQNDEDQMICRREKLTGSNLPGPKICKARKIWEQQQRDSQDFLSKTTIQNLQSAKPNG